MDSTFKTIWLSDVHFRQIEIQERADVLLDGDAAKYAKIGRA